MTAQEFYNEVWIKVNASDHRGDWPIRFAEAYATSQLSHIRSTLAEACSLLRETTEIIKPGKEK